MDDSADIQVVEATPDAENSQMHLVAKMAASVLCRHYPDHLWTAGWAPGRTLIIGNMAIVAADGKPRAYTVDAHKAATVSELEKEIIRAGGELLERANVARGRWSGELMQYKDLS